MMYDLFQVIADTAQVRFEGWRSQPGLQLCQSKRETVLEWVIGGNLITLVRNCATRMTWKHTWNSARFYPKKTTASMNSTGMIPQGFAGS